MLAQEIIRTKRDGHALSAGQIDQFVRGLVDGSWSEGQVAALAMAVFLRGMGRTELVIDARPTRVRCRECGCEYETDDFAAGCPCCGVSAVEIISGYECDIDTITYEEADA